MTLSLNPTLTQNKEKNTEIQVANTDLVTQHKPMPQLQAQNTDLNTQDNTESNTQAQEPIHQTQNTTQSFDINNKAYQDFVKAKLAAQKGAEVLNDKFSNNDYIQGAYRAVKESAKSFNPLDEETKERYNKGNSGDALWEAWNTITGQTALRNYNKEKLKEKEAQQAVYSYLEKYGTSKESIGLKNYEEDKLKEQKLIKGIQNKETKDLSEEEKDYLRDSESNISRFIDYLFTDENKNLQKYKNNLTRQNINHELVKKLVILDSQNSSIFNLTEDLQKEARQKTLTSGTKLAQMYGYDRLEYDAQAQDYVLIDKEGNKLYPDMQSVFNNLGTALEANYYDVVSSFIPVGKAAQVTKGGIKLTQSLTKTALQSAGMSAIASPLDYINMQNETAQEGDIQDILKHSAGNALGSAVGVYVGAGIAKGASKAYNSIKDLKNLSTDDLKNIKISKYLDNEEASIHRKLAKFNKSEIDSNYEIFKNLQSDRVISKEMKDPTFMGNFMDKISDYNVLKHLSSKKESQDKLLSALFSNKELAREFAGKLTSEEATIVNKAIHAMGENFTRLSKEYEQQIIDEYAKSGKIKGLNPHTEMQSRHVEPQAQTSHLNGNKDVFTLSQHDKGLNQYDINFNAPTKQVKSQMIEALKPIFNQTMTSSDGVQAYMSLKSLSKMTSPQAIQKSIDNGFSREEHLKAVLDIQRLFENAKLQATEPHKSGEKNAIIHRLNSELENGNALITTKESLDANKNRVYSLELELTPRFSDSSTPLNTKISEGGFNSQKGHQEQTIKAEPSIAKTDTDIIPQNLPEVYKHMLDEIDKQAKQDYKTSIDNLQNALNDTDFKATLLQGYKQVTDDAIESLGLDNQLTNTLIRETQKLESKPNISLSEAIELRKNINEIMRNYEKSSSDLKKFRANKHLDNIKDNIDNAIKNALDSKVAQNEANQMGGVRGLGSNEIEISPLTRQEADELFSNFQQANKNYAQIKESLNDKFAKALTKGMNKKDLDSRLTIEQWKQRVLDTQWGDSVKGLENTIFKNFNPRMQKHTQMLTILRALDRNVKLNDDTFPIDFTKILSDIENLEKLTLHPEIYPILDTFKSYAKSYQFAQEISKAKALENQVGSGALATTLEGRIKVFLTNRLFKKLFAFIPYIGDNAAITKALQSAIKDLKYPSEITLETLKVLNKADLDKGFKPIKDKENKPRFEYKANTPLSDKELQSQIRGNTQILNPKDTSEIEAIASNPLIQNMERQAKYNEELTQKISQFEANKENIQQDILNNLIVATQEIKQNTELLKQLAQQLTHNNPIHTPNKSIIKAEANNETYFITTDKNNITAIEKQELQLAQPKTYDELMQRDKNQNATLESYRDQYADIAEIKEAQAQKQLLLEYKPEVAKAETSVKDTQNIQDINFNILSQKNTGEVKKLIVKNLKDQELIGATITSKEGINATLSINSIGKMISDKAIQKSLDNGFSREEHLKAVLDIRPLFENAIRRESTQDKKGNGIIIHRLESNIDEKSLALITLKESQQHGRKIYTIELQLSPKSTSPSTPLNTKADLGEIPSQETKGGQNAETPIGYSADIIPQNPTKAQSEYFNPFMNEYEKIKEIKKLHTQDDNLIRVMKVDGRNDYIEPLSNMSVSKEYLQKQTAQSLKENITQAILGNQTQLKALQQGYNTYHLSPFQKEILESALDIANNPTKLKEYKLQGLQKQLNNLNNNESYHIEKGREYDKARYAKDRQELEKEIYALKGMESNPNIKAQEKALNNEIDSIFTYTTQETKGIKDLRNDLKEALMPYKTQPITNKETGMQGYITADEINKISSRKAVDKSIANGFSRDEHFAVAQDLKTLFENSKLRESHNDYKNNPNILQVHRFTKEISVNHKNANAQITLFEKIEGKNRIYTLELESLNKPDSLSVSVHNTESAAKAQSVATAHPETTPIAKTDTDIIPQKLTERIKNDLDSNDYAEMLKSLKQLENKQAEIDTFTNETNLIRNTLEKQETEKYEKIVSPLFDKYPIMKEFYNERDINTHIYFKRFKNEFLERYNTQYDFFTLDEKAFLAKYPNFTQQDYKEATTQNLKALKDKNVSINEYVSFAKEYMDIVNNPVFEKMAKEIDSVDKKYWDTHFEMSEQRDSKVNEIIAILKKNIDSIDIANKADVSIDNFHKLGRYLAFMKQPEFGFVNKLTFTRTGFFGKFLEQTDIKQRELLGELLSVEKLLEKEGKANRVLQDRLFTIFRLMRGEELLDRDIKDVPLARELIEKQLNIKPIKEFGTNYAEHYHSGESAIQKLINEAQAHKESGAKTEYKGQVSGAFHRKELGDIDLVWGNEKIGLQKIVEKHLNDFADFAGNNPYEKMSNAINEIIQNGKLLTENGVNTLWYKNGDEYYLVGISKGFNKQGDNNWVITSYKKDNITNLQKEKVDKLFSSDAEVLSAQGKFNELETLNSTTTNIIPQQTLESTMQKFNYDEKKAKDLLEWHKDSSPLTKDENGLPKVFYHGTTLSNMKRLHNKELKKPFEVFNTKDNSVSNFSIGNWFSNDKNLAKNYADDDEGNFIYEVFLNIKKPFIMEKELTQEKIKEIDKIFKFTKKDKERGLRAVENLKQAKAELKESGFEFLQYDRESVKIRHIESGKEFSTPLYNLKKEDLHESIRAYEADLKHNPNLDESLQELKELDSLLKKDSPTLYEAEFDKEFFKNETELYILAAARENEKLQEVVGGHYGVYGGYGRMYQTARIYPLQQFYKKAGYDGILFNDREIVAFDSNQIKHIDNKGSYTDTKGNITKTKPKNKESTHKYFNENSPNIMYANPSHLGSGILSGSAAGIETDENGNIVGFNPAKFAAGFLGGVAGSKAVSKIYKNKSAQRYATLAIKSIQQDYKSLSENNPAMFAKIMQKFNPRDFLKGKKQVQEVSKDIFNKELAQEIESALKNGKVETMPQAEFRNREEFAKMFDSIKGNKGVIKTPYKDIKVYIPYAWEHFTNNTYNTNRENIKGGFFETFRDPLFIVEQTQQGQKEPSVYFYKPFFDKDKNLMNLFGIGIQGHKIKFKTYYFDEKETRINNILKSENVKILYLKG